MDTRGEMVSERHHALDGEIDDHKVEKHIVLPHESLLIGVRMRVFCLEQKLDDEQGGNRGKGNHRSDGHGNNGESHVCFPSRQKKFCFNAEVTIHHLVH